MLALTEALEHRFADNEHFTTMREGFGRWNIVEVRKVGATCAFLKQVDPNNDYDAALVHQALLISIL